MNIFKKVSLLFILFLVIGIGCFALVDRDNINKDLNTKLEQTEKTYSGRIDSMTKYPNFKIMFQVYKPHTITYKKHIKHMLMKTNLNSRT